MCIRDSICSYLLVGFWYTDPVRTKAAKKVFFFTHMPGEALLLFAVGAYAWAGSVNINTFLTSTLPSWQMNTLLVLAFIGIFAKSAQTVSYTHLRAHETRHELVCR